MRLRAHGMDHRYVTLLLKTDFIWTCAGIKFRISEYLRKKTTIKFQFKNEISCICAGFNWIKVEKDFQKSKSPNFYRIGLVPYDQKRKDLETEILKWQWCHDIVPTAHLSDVIPKTNVHGSEKQPSFIAAVGDWRPRLLVLDMCGFCN